MQDLEPVGRTIVGDPKFVARYLIGANQRGALIGRGEAFSRPDGKVAVHVQVLEPVKPEPRRTLRQWLAAGSVAAEVTKALTFGAVLAGVVVGVIVAGFVLITNLIDGKTVLGALGVLILGLLIAGSRINHRGVCPGVAVHCKGCRY